MPAAVIPLGGTTFPETEYVAVSLGTLHPAFISTRQADIHIHAILTTEQFIDLLTVICASVCDNIPMHNFGSFG